MPSLYCLHCMQPCGGAGVCPYCGHATAGTMPGPHCLRPGTLLCDRYQIGEPLGEGGFGITYIGRDTRLDMRVAVKEYYPVGLVTRPVGSAEVVTASAAEADFHHGRERFLQEARILARFCGQPGIVGVRDFFSANNTVYIVMEYLEGTTLRQKLQQEGTLSMDAALALLQPVIQALVGIHSQGLIHRDISPDNIMLCQGQAKLLDFGAARTATSGTASVSVTLKRGYAPEEQYRTHGAQGPWTDIYALCATLYQCITGIVPEESMERMRQDTLQPPSAVGARIAPAQEAALMKGLAVLQEDRWQSAQELYQALYGSAAPAGTQPPPSGSDAATIRLKPAAGAACPAASPAQAAPAHAAAPEAQTVPLSHARPQADHDTVRLAQRAAPQPIPAALQGPAPVSPQQPVMPAPAGTDKAKKPARARRKRPILFRVLLAAGVLLACGIAWAAWNLLPVRIGARDYDRFSSFYVILDGSEGVQITPSTIKKIDTLPDVSSVTFQNTQVDADMLTALVNLKRVRYWTFESCVFPDGLFPLAESAEHLYDLEIRECALGSLDFLAYAPNLNSLTLYGVPGISDFSPIAQCSQLTILDLSGTGLTDFSFAAGLPALRYLTADGNALTSLSGLEACPELRIFSASGNQLTDISALSGMQELYQLQLAQNQLTDLSALQNVPALERLDVRQNQLANLDGLLYSTKLEILAASGNRLQSIEGLANCTQLMAVDLADNQIPSAAVLGKSAAGLKAVLLENNQLTELDGVQDCKALQALTLAGNQLTDISPLTGMRELQLLTLDDNQLTSLHGLEDAAALKYLTAANNQIADIAALSGLNALEYLRLSRNAITDISPLAQQKPADPLLLDLSHNQISDLSALNTAARYHVLALYDNPVTAGTSQLGALNPGENMSGALYFSCFDGLDLAALAGCQCEDYFLVDFPLDQQENTGNAILTGREYMENHVSNLTAADADAAMDEAFSAENTALIEGSQAIASFFSFDG